MNHQLRRVEAYKSVYANALILLQKDLNSRVQQFFVAVGGQRRHSSFDWHTAFGAHLAALDRDAETFHPDLQVPTLTQAVELWVDGDLPGWQIQMGKPGYHVQSAVNSNIHNRLQLVYENGDPLLTAISVMRMPGLIEYFVRHSGIKPQMIESVTAHFLNIARPIAQNAWVLMATEQFPSETSMFRPTLEKENGRKKYEN